MTEAQPDPNRDRFSTRLFYWWADSTWAQLLVLAVVSSLAGIGYVRPELVLDLFRDAKPVEDDMWFPAVSLAKHSSDKTKRSSDKTSVPVTRVQNRRRGQQRNRNQSSNFYVGNGECILIAIVDSPDESGFFTGPNLRAMYRIADELPGMPQVFDVMWLDNVPGFNLFGLAGTLMPSENASQRQMAAARKRVLENPLAVGQLISADGKTILMHLRLDWFFIDSNAAATSEIREFAEKIVAETPGADIRFQVTGQVPLHAMMVDNHVTDSTKYQLIGYSIMLISALVLFRGLAAVIIVAIAPAVGVAWTMGMLHFFELQDNPFNDIIVPVLISLVGLTDSVHLMVEIRQQRANGLDTRDAARRGVARVGLACLLTSVTTAIGFISLTWAHHEVVQDFGWCCVVGVAMTFISVLTVIPLGCRSPLGRRLHVGLGKSLVDGQLRRIGPLVDWVLRNDRQVAYFAILSTIVLAAISFQLTPDEKRYSGLSDSGEAAKGLRHLDDVLGGLEFGYVNVQWSEEIAEQGRVLSVLEQTDMALRDEPLIGQPIGLYQLLDALPGEGDTDERMTLLELLPDSLKQRFYNPNQRTASIQFRIKDIGIAAYNDTFERIESRFEKIKTDNPNFIVSLDGNAPWRWRNVFRIVTDLATSLGTASVVIWLVLTMVYRSFRIGMISVIPNLFPLVATGSVLYFSGQYLEIVTVCVFTICIGIAVDDTIHFLTRYQEELRAGGDHEQVIRRAFTGVGTALLMTTIVLVCGLGSAIVGDARDARLFGIMGCMTLATALFADIVLLPALLKRFALAKPKQ